MPLLFPPYHTVKDKAQILGTGERMSTDTIYKKRKQERGKRAGFNRKRVQRFIWGAHDVWNSCMTPMKMTFAWLEIWDQTSGEAQGPNIPPQSSLFSYSWAEMLGDAMGNSWDCPWKHMECEEKEDKKWTAHMDQRWGMGESRASSLMASVHGHTWVVPTEIFLPGLRQAWVAAVRGPFLPVVNTQ